MDYCGPHGIALSRFEAWDQLDQQMALEWQRRQNEKCPNCGIHPDQTDPELGGDPDALELAETLCLTCETSERHAKQFEKTREPGMRQVWKHRPAVQSGAAVEPGSL